MSVSTLLRRIARRSLKPLVMAGIAGALVVSLTVTTTQRAEATPAVAVAPVIAAAEGVLAGGVRLALPSLLSVAIATTPVGWFIGAGLAIGALAVGAYATRDYWMPFIAGAFGQPDSDKPAPEGSKILVGFKLTGLTYTAPNRLAAAYSYQGTTSSKTYTISAYFDCRQLTNTPPRVVGEVFKNAAAFSGGVSGQGQTGAPVLGTTGAGRVCPDGSEIIGGTMGPNGTTLNGPENVMSYGDVGGGFDPRGADVKYKTTAECIDEGGNKSSVSAEWFGSDGAAKIPSCAAAGKGHGTGKVGIEGYAPTAPGVPGTVAEPVWETQAPTSDPDHPLCGPQRPGPGCEMKITIDGNPCTIGAWDCENWTEIWKDPTTAPRVGCTYGPYTLAVDLCRIMEPAYRPGGAPATEENMDGDPATRNYTNPGGTTYTPPSTGTAPGGFPITGANPTTGEASPNCSAPQWSWNPIEFVFNPVLCAMQSAFVPKTDIQLRSDALRDQASEVVPISWLTSPITGPSGGGCPNWTINVQGLSQNVVCNSSFTAAVLGVRGPLFGLVAAAMVWPLIRGIWYASIPVLRVSPGSSK